MAIISARGTSVNTSRAFGFVVLVMSAGCAEANSSNPSIEKGAQLLKEHCRRCHATALSDESAHPQAPPFRAVMQRYRAQSLEEALAEGIVSGHPDMPVFTFSTQEIGEIVDYLDTLSAQNSNR